MPYFLINETPIRIKNIQEDPQLQRPAKPIIGANGSHVNYLGDAGTQLTIEGRSNETEHNNIKKLYKLSQKVTVTSPSSARYNGYYHITKFTATENKPDKFTINITLQKHFTFNVKRTDFVNYVIKPKTSSSEITVGETWDVD